MDTLKVLIGCEESQAVTIEMRKLGIEAYSCDTEPSSGSHPEWHIQGDVFEAINSREWDMGIFFPPCTFLTVTANRAMVEDAKSMFPIRQKQREDAVSFFMALYNANIPHIAIENPVGVMSTLFRKPDQIIQPYWFGDSASKSTCLWLKNLPILEPTNIVSKGEFFTWIDKKTGKEKRQPQWYADAFMQHGLNKEERRTLRSKTFPGIAKAMASQWT